MKAIGSLGYLSSNSTNDVSTTQSSVSIVTPKLSNELYTPEINNVPAIKRTEAKTKVHITPPYIDNNTKEWILTEQDIEFIAIGAGILGTGGGGTPYYAKVRKIF